MKSVEEILKRAIKERTSHNLWASQCLFRKLLKEELSAYPDHPEKSLILDEIRQVNDSGMKRW